MSDQGNIAMVVPEHISRSAHVSTVIGDQFLELKTNGSTTMKDATSSSDPPGKKQRKRMERALAIGFGLGALALFLSSLLFGAWVVIPFSGIIGWAAYGFWTGTNVPAAKGREGWEDSIERLDTTFDAEYSSVAGNINYKSPSDKIIDLPPPP